MKKIVFLLFVCTAFVHTLSAQFPGGAPGTGGGARGRQGGGAQMNIGHFYGRVIDKSTNKGLEAASVQLIQNRFDTVSKKRTDAIVGGMLTKPNGDFSVENLPLFGQYKLLITAIGFKPIEQKVSFDLHLLHILHSPYFREASERCEAEKNILYQPFIGEGII